MDKFWQTRHTDRREYIVLWQRRQPPHCRSGTNPQEKEERTLIEWKPVSARLLRASFYGKHSKEIFHSMLQAEKERIPAHDVLNIMGDFNAKVGSGNVGRERTMGSQGCGNMNENGEMLCDFRGLNNMMKGGTQFTHKDIHKLTWISPNARDQNQIDHIMINIKWRRS